MGLFLLSVFNFWFVSHILVFTVVTYMLTNANFRLVQTYSCFAVGFCRIDIATNCTNLQNPRSRCPITMNLFMSALFVSNLSYEQLKAFYPLLSICSRFGVQKSPWNLYMVVAYLMLVIIFEFYDCSWILSWYLSRVGDLFLSHKFLTSIREIYLMHDQRGFHPICAITAFMSIVI
jgi:hypothetical protein